MPQYFGANTRCFNQLKIDKTRGTITKSSTDEVKLTKELLWYQLLPEDLQYLGPRILSYSVIPGNVFIQMELYGYKALNTLWLSEDRQPSEVWDNIFSSISSCITDMGDHIVDVPASDLRDIAYDMYYTKTIDRLEKLEKDRSFDIFRQEELMINDRLVRGLPWILRNLDEVGTKAGIFNLRRASLIHGDLCLSNILYEPEYGFIRLIDPRGSFGTLSIHGDEHYELAKLSHSFLGNYDFYINGQFRYEETESGIYMNAMVNPAHVELKHRFRTWLKEISAEDPMRIKMIQSLLFLSMIPLHSDRPRAQKAFMCQGILDFNDVVDFQ